MKQKNSFYTVVLRPIPRGITRDELVSQHLAKFGQVKDVRFGSGRGVSGDFMYVDYFDPKSASAAVEGLDGAKDPGTSHLRLQASITQSTADAMGRIPLEIQDAPDRTLAECGTVKVEGFLKYLKPKTIGKDVCVLDLDRIS